MRSEVSKRISAKTPQETKLYVRKCADLLILINSILKEQGYTQKDLADKLGKTPSEISKWLNGEHNFTIHTICKLEAQLGVALLQVPRPISKVIKPKAYRKGCLTVIVNEEAVSGQHEWITNSQTSQSILSDVG